MRSACALVLVALVLFVSCHLLARKEPPAEQRPTLREELRDRLEKEKP